MVFLIQKVSGTEWLVIENRVTGLNGAVSIHLSGALCLSEWHLKGWCLLGRKNHLPTGSRLGAVAVAVEETPMVVEYPV